MNIRVFEGTPADIANWTGRQPKTICRWIHGYGFEFSPPLGGIANCIDTEYRARETREVKPPDAGDGYRDGRSLPRYVCDMLERNKINFVMLEVDPSVSRYFLRSVRREFLKYSKRTGKPVKVVQDILATL